MPSNFPLIVLGNVAIGDQTPSKTMNNLSTSPYELWDVFEIEVLKAQWEVCFQELLC